MTATIDRPASDEQEAPPPAGPPPEQREQRVRLSTTSSEGVASLVGSVLAGIALSWLLYQRVLPLSGAFGFWLCVAVVSVGIYAGACWGQWDSRQVVDRVMRVVLTSAMLLVVVAVGDLIGYTVYRGWDAATRGNFWTETMANTGALSPLSSGGMVHAMVGSLEQLGLATLFSVPLGVLAAIFLVEVGGPLARVVRTITEAMTALPEIVAGLFIFAMLILALGFERSGFAASTALTVMMIPVVTRTSEVILRLVPNTLREASYALGAGQASTVLRVVLPTARSGLATAVILAMARAVGETAPVLLTAGFSKSMNADPFTDPQASLPLYIFVYVRFPQPEMVSRAFGAGLALMLMVLVLFVLARIIGGVAPGETTRRQKRRRAAALAAPGGAQLTPPAPGAADVPVVIAPGYPDIQR